MVSQELLTKLNAISEKIIGAAIAVHKEFGPGLLESVYEICLVQEMEDRGLKVDYQVDLPQTDKQEIGVTHQFQCSSFETRHYETCSLSAASVKNL